MSVDVKIMEHRHFKCDNSPSAFLDKLQQALVGQEASLCREILQLSINGCVNESLCHINCVL